MDEIDRRLIIELQADPRKRNARLANSLGITERTVSRRIERLISSGDIVFTALPDMKRFGYSTIARIGIKINQPSRLSVIAEQLCQSPYLGFVSICEGFADIFVRGEFKSNEALADFATGYLGKIEGISQIDTMVELKEIKKKTFGRLENPDVTRITAPRTGDIAIDEVDRRLIIELQKDCRVPLKKLAGEVGMGESTVYRRIKHLVASGAIELTTIMNTSVNEYPAQGIIGIEAELPKLDQIALSISRHTQVQDVGIFSGPKQILAIIAAPSLEGLIYFATRELVKTEGIVRVDLLIHLKVLKRRFSWLQL